MIEKIYTSVTALLIMLLCMFSSVFAQSPDDAYRIETFSVNDLPTVQIETSGGSIKTIGHAENSVRVEMYVRRSNRYYSPSDTDLDDFEINISQSGNTVTASAERENSGIGGWFTNNHNFSISFVVYTPSESIVNGGTSGGSVSAENITHTLHLRTSGGSVKADKVSGEVSLRTSGGSISLTDSDGTIDARTSGGSINLDRTYGNINVRTSGGGIRVTDSGGTLSARTSGGSIRADLGEVTGDLDLRTSGGSIRIHVPGEAGYDLNLRGNRVNVDLVNFTGSSERNSIEGSMNGGGYKITARTSGGSVNLDFI